MAEVVLSYSSKDKARAERVAAALESCGLPTWWDHNLPPGVPYRREILRQLDTAGGVVVLWSKDSVLSDFVCDEANVGRRRGVLIPVLIDAVEPPLGFREFQTVSVVGWEGDAAAPAFQGIVAQLRRLLPAAASPSSSPFPAVAVEPTPAKKVRVRKPLAPAADVPPADPVVLPPRRPVVQIGLVLVAVAGMFAYGLWPADPKAAAQPAAQPVAPAAAAARPASGVRVLDGVTIGVARAPWAPAIRIASARCTSVNGTSRKLELAGSMSGPEGASLALITSGAISITPQCGAWSSIAASAAAGRAQCTRLPGQPERSNWSLEARLLVLAVRGDNDGEVRALVPKAIVSVEREMPGQPATQTLARDEATLDCR